MWVLFPFLFIVFGIKIAIQCGFGGMLSAAPQTFAYGVSWLWRQRTTLNTDPWEQVR